MHIIDGSALTTAILRLTGEPYAIFIARMESQYVTRNPLFGKVSYKKTVLL